MVSIEFIDSSIGVLNPVSIDNIKLVLDLRNMYVLGKVIIRDMGATMFNHIKIGATVDVRTGEGDTFDKKTRMAVLAFKKIPSPTKELTDRIEIDLVSSWYFISSTKTRAFMQSGTPMNVGNIVKDILDRDLDADRSFELDINDTEDVGHYRYQLNVKSQDFLYDILKYGTIQNLPVFLYTDLSGTIRLKGLYDFIHGTLTTEFLPMIGEAIYTDDSSQLKKEVITSYSFLSDVSRSSSALVSHVAYEHFYDRKDYRSSILNGTSELGNPQVQKTTPPIHKYYDWFVTPDDAVALSANESFNMTGGAFSLMCKTMDMRTSTYNLGDRIRVLLPRNSEAPTTTPNTSENIVLNEGDYIIGHIEFSYSSATGFSTEYLLLQMLY